jgi:hypothetical protein
MKAYKEEGDVKEGSRQLHPACIMFQENRSIILFSVIESGDRWREIQLVNTKERNTSYGSLEMKGVFHRKHNVS